MIAVMTRMKEDHALNYWLLFLVALLKISIIIKIIINLLYRIIVLVNYLKILIYKKQRNKKRISSLAGKIMTN